MYYRLRRRNVLRSSRGQTAIETAFVFTSILFFTFFMMNLGVTMHTKFIATYAAYMAARSYQVYGDQTNAPLFSEDQGHRLLDDVPTLAVLRTAEDIFTCALPWVNPPGADLKSYSLGENQDEKQFRRSGCMEGERQYQETNIDKNFTFTRFIQNDTGIGQQTLDPVPGAFSERGREGIRYGILRLQYKNELAINLFNVFDGPTKTNEGKAGPEANDQARRRLWHRVYVPVLLNPGLESGLVNTPPATKDDGVDEKAAAKTPAAKK